MNLHKNLQSGEIIYFREYNLKNTSNIFEKIVSLFITECNHVQKKKNVTLIRNHN